MNRPAMLADHLDAETDAIIAVWRSSVAHVGRRGIAKVLSSESQVDPVPALLDRLAERLRGLPADATAEGHEIGQNWWRQGYNVGEVVEELAELRTALIRATFAYARDQRFDLPTVEAVWEVICEVMNEATSEAVSLFQELNAPKTRSALGW